MSENDTIVAISTALGEGALAVVRLSGPQAFVLADQVFQGAEKPGQSESHRALYGHLMDPESGKALDEVVLTIFRAPHSYTGENVVEVSCHGGWVVPQRVLELFLKLGARLASPGEFTQRAFLNGRKDLAQAEAVADLIRAKTDLAQRAALSQLEGALSLEVNAIRDAVTDILAQAEASLEFPEEESLPPPNKELLTSRLRSLVESLSELLSSFQEGKILREGVKVAIVGKPNVGKSSIFNALLKEPKAIVTPVPGTTRDVLDGWLSLKGLPVLLSDTAGIREPGDVVEQEGVRRTKKRIEEAELVLLILDSSQELTSEDLSIVEEIRSKPAIAVLNKSDLTPQLFPEEASQATGIRATTRTSALQDTGLSDLKEAIFHLIAGSPRHDEQILVTNVRHARALSKAKDTLTQAEEALKQGLSEEFLAVELREVLNDLGEITGQTTTEDVLNRIFSSFCIGK